MNSRRVNIWLCKAFVLILILNIFGIRQGFAQYDSVCFYADTLSDRYGHIRFERGEGRYAFDDGAEEWYKKSVKTDRFYKPFARNYIAPWKFVPVGEGDVVTARYDGRKDIDLRKVRFVSEPNAAALPAQLSEAEQTWTVSLRSVAANSAYDVFAVYEGEVIGKLRVVSYAMQQHRVTLVPINEATLDRAAIEQELNAIYNPVGVQFTVDVDERMRGNYDWEAASEKDGLLGLAGTSFWGYDRELKESAEMVNLQQLYQQQAGTLSGAYLFVLDGAKGLEGRKDGLLGEMPRKNRFGYIFAGNSPNTASLSYTIAHELGHGLFTLQHTFDSEYGGRKSEATTANLMDYAGGKDLAAFQWNIMASPAVFTLLDDGEDEQLRRIEVGPHLFTLRIRELDFTLADTPGFTFDPQTGELRTTDAAGTPQTIALDVPPNGWESAFPLKLADDDGNMYELTLGERGEDEVQQIVVRDLHIEDEPYDASALSGYHWALDSLRLPNGSSIHEVRTSQAVRLALRHADRRLLDSIMLRVGDNTFSDTIATIRYADYQSPIAIQAQRKLQGRDTVVATLTINTHNAPILTFGTLSGYDGEFGYDDGEGLPTKDKVKNYPYRRLTIQSETNPKNTICPFISIGSEQIVTFKAEIKEPEQIKDKFTYTAKLVAYKDRVIDIVKIPYDKKTLKISYSKQSDSMFVDIYRQNVHSKKEYLIGQCEVVQRKFVTPPIDVKVIHYQTKKENINIINTESIQDFLNNHSHNQLFLQYNVSLYHDCMTIVDTTFINRITKEQNTSNLSLSGLILNKMIETIRQRTKLNFSDFSPSITLLENKNRTLYLFATDIKRKSVTGSSGDACMVIYSMDRKSQEIFNHTIAHEFGHCVGLQHPFDDDDLGKPTQGECKSNFMDYVEERLMFFKSQILIVLNGLYAKLTNGQKK